MCLCTHSLPLIWDKCIFIRWLYWEPSAGQRQQDKGAGCRLPPIGGRDGADQQRPGMCKQKKDWQHKALDQERAEWSALVDFALILSQITDGHVGLPVCPFITYLEKTWVEHYDIWSAHSCSSEDGPCQFQLPYDFSSCTTISQNLLELWNSVSTFMIPRVCTWFILVTPWPLP